MGRVKGDKARFNRERREKLARRVKMRALRATLGGKGAAAAPPKAEHATQPAGHAVRPGRY